MNYLSVIFAFAALIIFIELVHDSRASEVHLGNIGGVKQWSNPTTFAIRR